MTQIIIVGHPQADTASVEQLLRAAGMAAARPSRREGLRPQDVNTTIIQVHGAVPIDALQSAAPLQQIQVAPVWQGMVLDLMLGNLEHRLWGWTDPQAVYLLDYWQSLDSNAIFVLAYDAPHTALTRLSLAEAGAPEQELQRRLDAWVAYNSAVLHFHLRHPERSVLVHSQQIKPLAAPYLQYLSERIALPLALSSEEVLQEARQDALVPAASEAAQPLLADAQLELLASLLIDANPAAQTLYAELQAASTLSPGMQSQALVTLADPTDFNARYRAWQACVAQQQHVQQLSQRILALSAQSTQLQGQAEQEKEALLTQLHQVQEELECRYLKDKEQTKAHAHAIAAVQAELQAKNKQLTDAQTELKHAAQQHAQKIKEMQQAEQKQKSQERQQERDLILHQLHQVQEELERYYLENQALKVNQKPKADRHYGAAERVKQDLPYRLGARMINQSRSLGGCLRMPFALRAEAKRFRQSKVATDNAKLPPISQYSDAAEAERIKNHLSYRLGACLLAHAKSPWGWLKMPWALRAEVRAFRQTRR